MADFGTEVEKHIRGLIKSVKDEKARYATAFAAATQVADQYTQMAYKNEPPEKTIACKKGCGTCCAGAMGESLSICEAEYLCLTEMFGEIEPVENGCPFLDDYICSIYQYRPVMCRAMNSYDAEWCKEPPLMYAIGPDGDAPIYHPQYHLVMAT
ncbi:MAG: YkgJ family cysteine cluster protein, partial [Candidatus Thorarchaeota archaeon]